MKVCSISFRNGFVTGTIIGRTPAGFLFHDERAGRSMHILNIARADGGDPWRGMVDRDPWRGWVKETGIYSYTAAGGAQATVREFVQY